MHGRQGAVILHRLATVEQKVNRQLKKQKLQE
jgi:hypothetical protein